MVGHPHDGGTTSMIRTITKRGLGVQRANANARELEHLVERSQSDARGRVVEVFKIPMGAKFIWRGGKREAVHQKTPFDFGGTVCGSGRGLFFDCKSVGSDNTGLRCGDA